MAKEILTVCSVVYNDNQTKLFDLMVKSVLKFTDHTPKFIICDNGGNDLDKYKSLPNFTIISNINSKSRGSLGHGEGLNKVFELVDTQKTAIVESDCIILSKDWDKIDFPKYKMLAAKKGDIAGQFYYHICFMVFGTEILRHNNSIDFRPGKEARVNRSYKLHEDVGWQVRDKIRQDQVKFLEFVDCKSGRGKYFNNQFQSDEFWLDEKPIVAHFGRGSNLTGKAIRGGFENPKEQLAKWKNIAQEIIK